MKTAKKISDAEMIASNKMLMVLDCEPAMTMTSIFNTMRILKRVNPGDTYYEAYLGMRKKYGKTFFDTYQVLWAIGVYLKPRRILEIGTRTGISLCQLLSAHNELETVEKVVCVDPFDAFTSANLVRTNLAHLNINLGPKLKIEPIRSQDYFTNLKSSTTQETFDYILVDGDHSKEVAGYDLREAHELLEKGGIIVFDDISTAPGECALLDVWEAWKTEHEGEYTFTEVLEGKGVAIAIKL